MISASHNPPSDNAIKVFWQDGAQVRPPFDQQLIDEVNRVEEIVALAVCRCGRAGLVRMVEAEMDRGYQQAVLQLACANAVAANASSNAALRILYSPLHGVGRTSVEPVLQQAGFSQLEIYAPQAEPSGDFPNVPDHVANPENPQCLSNSSPLHERKSLTSCWPVIPMLIESARPHDNHSEQ